MKGIWTGLILAGAVAAGFFAINGGKLCTMKVHDQYPSPTETQVIDKEDGEESEREKREEWINLMHKAAPGTDWRKMDARTRADKYVMRNAAFKTTSDTLANGNLIGEWKERGSVNQAGRIVRADFDTTTNTIFAGSAGGQVWKGNFDGTGWTPLNDLWKFDDIKMVKAIPHNGGRRLIVPAGRNNVFLSDDDGASWFQSTGLTNASNWGGIRRALVLDDSRRTIYMLLTEWDYANWNAENSIYRSLDHGTTFSKVASFDEPTYGGGDRKDIWAPQYNDTTAYFLRDSVVYELDYATGNPVQISTFPLTANPGNTGNTMLVGMSMGGNATLYAYIDQDIYRSTDNGINWSFRGNIGKSPFNITSFSADLSDPDILYFGDVDTHKSTDGGQTWNQTSSWVSYYNNPATKLHADIPAIIPMMDANNTEFQFICTDGGIYKSYDRLQTVQNISMHGLNVSQYYTTYTHRTQPDYIYVGTQDQGFQRCQLDSGTVLGFSQIVSGDYGHIVSGNEGQSIWMNYPGSTSFYFNARFQGPVASWGFTNFNNPLWIPPLMEIPGAALDVMIAGGNLNGSGSHMVRLSYNGGGITAAEMPFDFENASGGSFVSAMAYSPTVTTNWYALSGNGKFFRSSDSGTNWTVTSAFSGPTNHYFYGSDIVVLSNGTIFIAGSGYTNPGVAKSTNGGATFTPIQGSLPQTMVFAIVANQDESVIFAATEVGPYAYVISENQWYDISNGQAPDQVYWCVDYIPATRTARFGTYGRGLWDFTEDPLPVAVAEALQGPEFTVFPNPASSFVKYTGCPVGAILELTDVSGRSIRKLKAMNETGEFSVSDLPSGNYFLGGQLNGQKWVKRIAVQH